MYFSDEIFIEEIVQKGWIDRVLAQAALSAFENQVKTNPSLHVWNLLETQGLITSEQNGEIRREWAGGLLPILGGYKLLRLVGAGSMGYVYEALQEKLDKKVALKILTKEAGSNFEFLTRFRQEAKAAAVLNHPNIVQAFDVGEYLGWQYMVMEYVEGKTLRQLLKEDNNQLEAKQALEIVQQISLALDHSSSHEIIHRDIRPDNILISQDGVAKLADFGLVKQLGGDKRTLSLTMAGTIIGDPYYIPPEQSMGDSNTDLDVRSDIYALGITLYEILTGRLPFSGDSPIDVVSQHLNAEPPRVSSLRENLPPGVEDLVHKMMEKSPGDRFQTPLKIVETIEGLLGIPAPRHGTQRFTKSFSAKALASATGGGPSPNVQVPTPPPLMRGGSYYIENRQIQYGITPPGIKPIDDIFQYYLKVCDKLGGILHQSIQNVALFAGVTGKNKEIIEKMKISGAEDPSLVLEMIKNYRQLFGLTLHPMVQGLLGQEMLGAVRAKINTYFSHLGIYFKNLGVSEDLCQTEGISSDEALPVLQSLGLASGGQPAPPPTPTASPIAPTPPATPPATPPVVPPMVSPEELASYPTEEIDLSGLDKVMLPPSALEDSSPPSPPSQRVRKMSDTDVTMRSLDSMLASEKEGLSKISPPSDSPSVGSGKVDSEADSFFGQGIPPAKTTSKEDPLGFLGPDQGEEENVNFLSNKAVTPSKAPIPPTPPAPSPPKGPPRILPPGTPPTGPPASQEVDLDASLQSLLGGGEDSRFAQPQPPPSTAPTVEPTASVRPSAPEESPLKLPGSDQDSGSWLLGDELANTGEPATAKSDEGGAGADWLLGGDSADGGGDDNDSGSWFLGDDAAGLSIGNSGEDERVISLWGNDPSAGAPKTPAKLHLYDPQKEAGGSSFIDVRYDMWYRNDASSQSKEPLIELRLKKGKGQQARYQEIYIRIKSFRGMDKSGDSKFIIILEKESSIGKQATWYDSVIRKKLVYTVKAKSLKGAPPDEALATHPFETPNRDVNRIIKTALKNYLKTK